MSDTIGTDELAVEMTGVHKWFGEFHVLKDINFRVGGGERVVICGPSVPASPRSVAASTGLKNISADALW
jgi:ABC-type polar amino acid transport system ATPase subunit